jgi:hypothetical protein
MYMGIFGKKRAAIDLSRKNTVTPWDVFRALAPIVYGALFVILAILAIHYYRLASELRAANPTVAEKTADADPVTDAIVAVEKHILLPQGERPQVARVSDLAPLANIPFFGNALVGDQVIVYCKASLSILYSSSRDRVIEVSRTPVAGSCTK